jgi:H/ACA ribonucleoprotein complex subunit 1
LSLILGSTSGGFRGGRGGFGGGGNFSTGPPDQVFGFNSFSFPLLMIEMGTFMHASEGDMLYESTNTKIPYFNAPIYLENKVSPSEKNVLTIVITGKSR